MKPIIALLPITKGEWVSTKEQDWEGLYFMELVFDWSILPKGSVGKLYCEIMDDTRNDTEEHTIEIRLAYQQEPAKFIPVIGSVISHTGSKRWQLKESPWFPLPTDKGVSCLWIQGRTTKGGKCAVALVTLAIAEDKD